MQLFITKHELINQLKRLNERCLRHLKFFWVTTSTSIILMYHVNVAKHGTLKQLKKKQKDGSTIKTLLQTNYLKRGILFALMRQTSKTS